jgi:hypothetical protein
VILLATTALLVVGCSTAADSQFDAVGGSISGSGGMRDAPSSESQSDDGSRVQSLGPEASNAAATVSIMAGRDIVVVGAMTVEVEDLTVAQPRAVAAVEGLGGFIAEEQSSFGEQARATVTYRLPAESYEAAVRVLGELGEVREQSRQTEDVSTQLVDLESRLATAQASVARLRSFFEQAGDLTQVALLEGELLKREAEVETLAASLRGLEDRVALSTLVVTWQEPPPEEDDEALLAAGEEDDEELPTFMDGLATGWRALLRGGQVGSAALGLFLPFLPVVVVFLGVQRLSRRFRRHQVPAA